MNERHIRRSHKSTYLKPPLKETAGKQVNNRLLLKARSLSLPSHKRNDQVSHLIAPDESLFSTPSQLNPFNILTTSFALSLRLFLFLPFVLILFVCSYFLSLSLFCLLVCALLVTTRHVKPPRNLSLSSLSPNQKSGAWGTGGPFRWGKIQ